jgi:hypothetical protein
MKVCQRVAQDSAVEASSRPGKGLHACCCTQGSCLLAAACEAGVVVAADALTAAVAAAITSL